MPKVWAMSPVIHAATLAGFRSIGRCTPVDHICIEIDLRPERHPLDRPEVPQSPGPRRWPAGAIRQNWMMRMMVSSTCSASAPIR